MSLLSRATMNDEPALRSTGLTTARRSSSLFPRAGKFLAALAVGASLLAFAGCATQESRGGMETKIDPEIQTLRVGDVIKIEFLGAPNLSTSQTIRRDGKVSLQLIGEMKVVDRTPAELEKDLAKAYASQVLSTEVSVTVASSSFPVILAGAVARPGKIIADHALTAFEAVMEAGGFAPNAYSKAVVIIRQQPDGTTKQYILDLKAVLDGKKSEPFFLKTNDVVYVKEKFNWF
jgi:polysaccharide biosynthesis/export protein